MWRILFLLGALGLVLAGAGAFASAGAADLAAFGPLAAVVALLAVAAALPLALSARADLLRVPWKALAAFAEREAPFEAAVLVMLAASLGIGALGLGQANAGLVALLAAAGVFAASVEHWFPYVPGTTD
jgi:hypothetical protein